jgi:hypothetical protein
MCLGVAGGGGVGFGGLGGCSELGEGNGDARVRARARHAAGTARPEAEGGRGQKALVSRVLRVVGPARRWRVG